jgi:hypothetical protein
LTTGTAGGVPPPQKYFFSIYFELFSPTSKDHHFYLLKVADGCSTRQHKPLLVVNANRL